MLTLNINTMRTIELLITECKTLKNLQNFNFENILESFETIKIIPVGNEFFYNITTGKNFIFILMHLHNTV